MQSTGWLTIPDVFRLLGYEPVPADTWAAGAAMREAYRGVTGEYPVKALRPKTSGPGSHCFALYPPDWLPKMKEVVKVVASEREKQFSLF